MSWLSNTARLLGILNSAWKNQLLVSLKATPSLWLQWECVTRWKCLDMAVKGVDWRLLRINRAISCGRRRQRHCTKYLFYWKSNNKKIKTNRMMHYIAEGPSPLDEHCTTFIRGNESCVSQSQSFLTYIYNGIPRARRVITSCKRIQTCIHTRRHRHTHRHAQILTHTMSNKMGLVTSIPCPIVNLTQYETQLFTRM